jgi:adenosylcobinamide-phosphate synthase
LEITQTYVLLAAFLLDWLIGDPQKLPHLIVGYGKAINRFDKLLNTGKAKFVKGALGTAFLVISAGGIPYLLLALLSGRGFDGWAMILSTIILFYCLANRTLVDEAKAVFSVLENQGLEFGRTQLSRIVGRDTNQLDSNQVRQATLETMSENLSDGVIAPMFYFFILGIPGAMMYKMINTLDSMIGYKNERYIEYGKFAARLDDVANYLPSRITALLMLLVSGKLCGTSFVFREGKKHSSPNAGYPEAALAYILDCQFGGPNQYHGDLVNKAYIGKNPRSFELADLATSIKVNKLTSLIFCSFGILFLAAGGVSTLAA